MNAGMDLNNDEGGRGWRRYALLLAWALAFVLVDAFLWFRVHWAAGLAFALVAPLALPFLLPRRAMRLLVVLYLVWAVAWLSGTYFQGLLAENAGRLSAWNRVLAWLLGSYEMQVVCAAVAGLLLGLVVVGSPLFLLAWVAAEGVLALNELLDVSRGEAIRLVLMALLNLGPPWLVIDEGKEIESKPKGLLTRLGGPGLVVVQEGNAAIFQKGGRITKVVGPGRDWIAFLERTRCVLDLRPQWENRLLENVRTRDHVPLTVKLGIGFRIEPKEETDSREGSHDPSSDPVLGQVYQVYESTVRKAAFHPSGDWRLTTVGMVENALRDVVATYDFDQLFRHEPGRPGGGGFDPNKRIIREIEDKVLRKVRPIAAEQFGVSITAVDVSEVRVPDAVQERLLEWWGVRWYRVTEIVRAEAEKEALQLKGQGQAAALEAVEEKRHQAVAATIKALERLVSGVAWRDVALAQRLASVIERLIGRMVTEDVLTLRMLEALEKLSEGKGEVTVFLGGEGMPFLSPPEGQGREPE
ncbi:MAG: SPFH domain-containing protein [Anaerolineae bacterium]